MDFNELMHANGYSNLNVTVSELVEVGNQAQRTTSSKRNNIVNPNNDIRITGSLLGVEMTHPYHTFVQAVTSDLPGAQPG